MWPIFILSLATFIFYVIVFFISLNSLVSDYSWGDIVYHHQIFYNFLHGRPFQTSVYWHALVNSINPYAYLNIVNIHLYLSPFLFSPIYFLVPNLNGLYFTVMAVSYVSLAFFLWKLVCLYTLEDRLQKYLLVMSFVLASAFTFSLIVGKASPILLGLPFLLAAYYFLQREKYILYYTCSLLFCLSYDDCGLVFVSFLAYIFFFEKKHLKPAVVTAIMGLMSVGLIIGLLQPLARINIPGKSVASVFDAAGVIWNNVSGGYISTFLHHAGIGLLLFGSLALAFPVILLRSKRTGKQGQDLYQCLGLIFLAPLSHWVSIVVNVGVHFMPVVAFTLIAITLAISRSALTIPATWSLQSVLVLAIISLYLAGNIYAFFFMYPQHHYGYISSEYVDEEKANALCLQNIKSLVPEENSLTYWTARGLDGFLGNRSNLWRFPHFFDQTDYLVIQKNAKNTFFQAKILPGQNIYQSLRNGTQHSTGQKVSIDSKLVDAVCDELGNVKNSHTIMFDDPEMVVLKRKDSIRFEQPVETYGFGFLKNFPKYWNAKFQG